MIDMNKIVKESDLEEESGITDISLKRALYFKQNGWNVKIFLLSELTIKPCNACK